MAIRSLGSTTASPTSDELQKSPTPSAAKPTPAPETPRAEVMTDTRMREALTKRLSMSFQQSKTDFQAQQVRQQLDTALPAASPAPIDITKSPNFTSLQNSQKAIITNALASNPGNTDLQSQFQKMIDAPKFQSLPMRDKTYALSGLAQSPGARADDLLRFTQTTSYQKFSGPQRQSGQMIMGVLSADASLNPSHNPMSRNTVELLASGNVLMGLPTKSQLKRDGFTDADLQGLYGFADGNKMNFNMYLPGLLQNRVDLERTAAHEINHVVNDRVSDTDGVTPERALDEYRAWYVENFAVGIKQPTVEYMRDVYDNFFGPNAGYDNIREIYQKDPDFHAVIDTLKANLDKGIVTDPESLRKMLVPLIGKDKFITNPKYLMTPANLDNHIDKNVSNA